MRGQDSWLKRSPLPPFEVGPSEISEPPLVSQTGLTWRVTLSLLSQRWLSCPKKQNLCSLNCWVGTKEVGWGVFCVCVHSTVCQWHNRCRKLCFFNQTNTFSWQPGNLIKLGFRVLLGGNSVIYLQIHKSSCSHASHILCTIDQPKKENAFKDFSKGANWCNSASRLHVWQQLRGRNRFIQLLLTSYTHLHLFDQQDNEILSLCLVSNKRYCNKYNYIEK